MSGKHDKNIRFDDLKKLLLAIGFEERIKGGHFLYSKTDVVELLNIQSDGDKAKPYQIKQVRNIIEKYNLGDDLNA